MRMVLKWQALMVCAATCGLAASARADFEGRYLTLDTSHGFDAYYDTTLGVTWLADALYGGRMDWDTADNWVAGVRLGGYDDWRLPTFSDGSGAGSTGEFYHMWVVELGNNDDAQHPTMQFNPGPFHNVEYYMGSGAYHPNAAYWTSHSYSDFAMAWMTFNAFYIGQYKEGTAYGVWLCRSGDSGWAPPACSADFDGDGTVDFFDYDALVNCFEGLACPPGKSADFDGDGAIDFFDYDAFVVAFETGC
ncbi:MAG: hypothetical protein AABZ53_16440 [Planctomycetota bacterium]